MIEKTWGIVSVMHPNIKKDFHYPESDVWVYARRRPMEHALLNLFTNACQAMEGEGWLYVRIDRDERSQEWRIEIEDTGPGIASEHIDQVFKPFFSTKSAGEGSGLGLALVERVIRENGGSISVESQESKGAIFEIVLPVCDVDPDEDEW